VSRVSTGDLCDDRPVPRFEDDEAFLPKPLDRLPDGRTADPHALGDSGLIEALARLQTPLNDAPPQLVKHLLAD